MLTLMDFDCSGNRVGLCSFSAGRINLWSFVLTAAAEQSELCRIARGLGETEMTEGV